MDNLLGALKQKRDELINSAKQFGQGYVSTPQQGQAQDPSFQAGQGMAMMPPTTGVGVGDDVMRMAGGIMGKVAPELGPNFLKSQELERAARVAGQRLKNNPEDKNLIKLVKELLLKATQQRVNP